MSAHAPRKARRVLLLPYQARWVADQSKVQVSIKSRRIGITWASAMRAVIEGSMVGGNNTYYTGYKTDLAKEFIREAGEFARALNVQITAAGEEIFKDIGPDGEPRDILAHTITFATGYRIVALSSSPRNLRGIKGRVIIDEAAFHDNLPELLKAALATLIWGGKVSIISTHNGVDNAYNRLIEDIESGRFDYSLHKTTIDDAIAEGLYERIATLLGLEISEDAQARWRNDLVAFYGEGADEELFCIPRKGGGVYIGPGLIEPCMRSDYLVHAISVDDAFTHLPEAERYAQVDQWLATLVRPRLHDPKRYGSREPLFLGEDFGRKSDLTSAALGFRDTDGVLHCPDIFELRNVPYDCQRRFIRGVLDAAPVLGRAAVDGTGNGAPLGEHLVQTFGETVIPVGVAGNGWITWYPANLPHLKAAFENAEIRIPKSQDVRADLTSFQVLNGVPTLPKLRKESLAPGAGKSDYRHADSAIALALLEYAARSGSPRIEHDTRVNPEDEDDRYGPAGTMW